jgi:very-short-patch-repair endonuclease/predicted transcriptional regulator of viral defense system
VSAEFSIQQPHRHTPSPDERIAAFARRQHGLITLLQLLAAGLVRSQISRRVTAGRLHRVHRGVYAVGHADLSREARWHAATLAGGEGSALGLLSAGTLHEISRFRSPLIAVVSPRLRIIEGVRVHRYRHLDPRDLTTHKGIPVTTVHRTQVDLTDVLTPHQLTNVIYRAAYKGRYVEAATRDSMARANGRRNLHVLDKAIALYNAGSAGTRSGAEDALLALTSDEPLVNMQFEGFEVDFRWPDLRLAVEIDGPHHGRPRDRDADARQDRALQAVGYETLRFTDEEVYQRPDRIREALSARRPTPSSSSDTRRT